MKIINSINNSTLVSADHAKLLLRVVVGFLVLLHGIFKLQNPAALDFVGDSFIAFGLPHALAYLVFIGEIVAPLMIIAGYQTKIGALLITINMFVVIVLVHLSQLFTISPKGGGHALELQLMFLAGAIAIFGLGAGKYKLGK